MLAFNLAIYFQNLADTPLQVTVQEGTLRLNFTGQVKKLTPPGTPHMPLQVVLGHAPLELWLSFLPHEDEERENNPDVTVQLRQSTPDHPNSPTTTLLEGTFAFDTITLKPLNSPDDGEDDGPEVA